MDFTIKYVIIVFSACSTFLCEEISVFQLTENIPVKEGGDAVLSCNFGMKVKYVAKIKSYYFSICRSSS